MNDTHPTQVHIHLDRLTHNLRLLQSQAGNASIWPVIKANAYGHGIDIIARHLFELGYDTLCVAHVEEAAALIEAGIRAHFVLLSPPLAEQSQAIVNLGCQAGVCTLECIEAIAREAKQQRRRAALHLMVDTGMGRDGILPEQVPAFLQRCSALPSLEVRGLMTHFPCADQTDKSFSLQQIASFRHLAESTAGHGIEFRHMANSAAIFDLPSSRFDAVRPGIAIYGLPPSATMLNPRVNELQPILEWKTRIAFLKEVPANTGLSYGHSFHTKRPSLIATVPVGYGDGLSRRLSDNLDLLVRGQRCPQVGRISMDQSLIDVTALRGRVRLGDEVVIIGQQGEQALSADELAQKLGTINYEVVTRIAERVPRKLIRVAEE